MCQGGQGGQGQGMGGNVFGGSEVVIEVGEWSRVKSEV